MEAFTGTILPVGFNYAPADWAFCSGQLIPVAQNQTLFSLLSTLYGGDGHTTFALPDLRGRAMFGQGTPVGGIAAINIAQTGGTNTIAQLNLAGSANFSLTANNLPEHNHAATVPGSSFSANSVLNATSLNGGSAAPSTNAALCDTGSGGPSANVYKAIPAPTPATNLVPLNVASVVTSVSGTATINTDSTGTGQAVNAPVAVQATNINKMPPFIGMNFIIALYGIYPTRN